MFKDRINGRMPDPELYPFESRYVMLGGHQLHYLEEGQGETIVMLHGNPSWSFYYRHLIRSLSPFYHCIAPDHIGMGYSDKPDDKSYRYTLSQRVKDLEDFLHIKEIRQQFTLILHDWGGIIGMSFAGRHPELIKKIIVLNTAAFHPPANKKIPLFLRFARTFAGEFIIRAFNGFSFGATIVGVKRKKMPARIRRGYTAPYNSWKNRIAVFRFVQDIPVKKEDPGFQLVTDMQTSLHLFRNIPVMIAWGMKDPVFDESYLNKWIDYLPHALIHRFEDCGHYVLEDAQDEIGKLVIDFMAEK